MSASDIYETSLEDKNQCRVKLWSKEKEERWKQSRLEEKRKVLHEKRWVYEIKTKYIT